MSGLTRFSICPRPNSPENWRLCSGSARAGNGARNWPLRLLRCAKVPKHRKTCRLRVFDKEYEEAKESGKNDSGPDRLGQSCDFGACNHLSPRSKSTPQQTRVREGTSVHGSLSPSHYRDAQSFARLVAASLSCDCKNESSSYGKNCRSDVGKTHSADAADLDTSICGWNRCRSRHLYLRMEP
jgi:hypothetical protein